MIEAEKKIYLQKSLMTLLTLKIPFQEEGEYALFDFSLKKTSLLPQLILKVYHS